MGSPAQRMPWWWRPDAAHMPDFLMTQPPCSTSCPDTHHSLMLHHDISLAAVRHRSSFHASCSILEASQERPRLLHMLRMCSLCACCCSTAGLVPSAGTGSRLLHRRWRPGRPPRRPRLCPRSRQMLYAGPGCWQPAWLGLRAEGRVRGVSYCLHEQEQCQHVHVAVCKVRHMFYFAQVTGKENGMKGMKGRPGSHLHSVGRSGRRCAILGLQA